MLRLYSALYGNRSDRAEKVWQAGEKFLQTQLRIRCLSCFPICTEFVVREIQAHDFFFEMHIQPMGAAMIHAKVEVPYTAPDAYTEPRRDDANSRLDRCCGNPAFSLTKMHLLYQLQLLTFQHQNAS